MKTRLLSFEEVQNLPEGTKVYHTNDRLVVGEVRTIEDSHFGYAKVIKRVDGMCFMSIVSLEKYQECQCKTYEWIDDANVLTGDKIRALPHGTKVKYVNNWTGDSVVSEGVINQDKQWIGLYNDYWCFTNLERREVKAWVVEEPKQEEKLTFAKVVQKIEDETPIEDYIKEPVKEYNLVEMVEEMKKTQCQFRDKFGWTYSLQNSQLSYLDRETKKWEKIGNTYASFLLKKFTKLIPKQEPVDFIKAIRSGRKIRVEHGYINSYSRPVIECQESTGLELLKKGKFYFTLRELLTTLSYFFDDACMANILSEGKWYIEGDK